MVMTSEEIVEATEELCQLRTSQFRKVYALGDESITDSGIWSKLEFLNLLSNSRNQRLFNPYGITLFGLSQLAGSHPDIRALYGAIALQSAFDLLRPNMTHPLGCAFFPDQPESEFSVLSFQREECFKISTETGLVINYPVLDKSSVLTIEEFLDYLLSQFNRKK